MGHEQVIQQKILATEQQPIAWDKTRVWQNIRREGGSKPRFVFYYAAASLIIAVCLILYFGLRNEQGELSSKPRASESVTSADSKENPLEKTNRVATPAESDESKPQAINKKYSTIAIKKTEQEMKIQLPDTVQAGSFEVSLPEEDRQIFIETEDQQAIQPRVEAIVGIIPEQKQNIVVIKTKKIHLRLLRDNEKAYRDLSEEGHHKTLTARIN